MLTKNQVKKAIKLDYPDNIPQLPNLGYHGATYERYGEQLRDLVARNPDDIICHISPDPRVEWGLDIMSVPMGSYCPSGSSGFTKVKRFRLEDWNRLDSFLKSIPDPYKVGMFQGLEELRQKHDNRYLLSIQFALFKEKMDLLRGMEKIYTDLYLHRDKIDILFEAFLGYTIKVIEKCGEVGVDGMLLADDWGSQRSLLISPKMWREIFKPWYKRVFDKVHGYGMDVFFHSDGNIKEIIPDLIKIGVDVLNPLQPDAMDIKEIVRDFRGKVCFWTGLDVRFLAKASAQEVKENLYDTFKLFDHKKGGFIIGPTNAFLPDIPLENFRAMYQAINSYKGKRIDRV